VKISMERYLDAVSSSFGCFVKKLLAPCSFWALSTREVALTAHLVMPHGGVSDNQFLLLNQELKKKFGVDHPTLQIECREAQFPCAYTAHCELNG